MFRSVVLSFTKYIIVRLEADLVIMIALTYPKRLRGLVLIGKKTAEIGLPK